MGLFPKFLVLCAAAVYLTAAQGASAFSGMGSKQAPGAEARKQPAAISGKVLETMTSGGYTYVCIEKKGGKMWLAMPETKVTVGEEMAFIPGNIMTNFNSKTLGRTFDKIMFSPGPAVLPGSRAAKEAANAGPVKGAAPAEKVGKATGANAYSVAELFEKSAKLNKKEVTVKGKVVKVSAGIMDTNWIHLQDGTGDPRKGTDDLVVTSDHLPSVGEVVTMSGTVAKDKDFGYGYKYDVILEKAVVVK